VFTSLSYSRKCDRSGSTSTTVVDYWSNQLMTLRSNSALINSKPSLTIRRARSTSGAASKPKRSNSTGMTSTQFSRKASSQTQSSRRHKTSTAMIQETRTQIPNWAGNSARTKGRRCLASSRLARSSPPTRRQYFQIDRS